MANPQSTLAGPAEAASGSRGGPARRVLVAVLVFVVVIALSILLPRSLPGEMPSGELTRHAGPGCASCPPTDQISAAGLAATQDGLYVNVRFAAPPLNTLLRVSFAAAPGELDLLQSGDGWRYARLPGSGVPRPTGVMSRGDALVLAFPATLRAAGVSVSTGTGDRLPQSGYLPPTYPAPAHFNATDVFLLLVLALTAWYGYTRGFLPELADLAVLGASLAVAGIAYRPLARMVAGITGSRAVGAVAGSALLVVVLALTGFFLVKRYLPRIGTMAGPFDARVNGVLGGATGCLRQLPVLALLLAAGTDLAVLHWASRSIHSSLLGSALIHAWKVLFPAAHV